MKQIRKVTGNTYFEGDFSLRPENDNWAAPIDFPTVFVAYGKGIKSGNWQSCTAINTPQYVIDNYFNGKKEIFKDLQKEDAAKFWNLVFKLSELDNQKAYSNKAAVLGIISQANELLNKLTLIN